MDLSKSLEFFDPLNQIKAPIHVIGIGAMGSRVAELLVRLGVTKLHIWDMDKVEPKNIANQVYLNHHIGMQKVDALEEYLKDIKMIHIVNLDAILFKTNEKFDLIFIDGAKSHQEIMFEHCQKFLNNNGIIVVDNIFLKKFNNRKQLTRNQKRLLSKVKEFET